MQLQCNKQLCPLWRCWSTVPSSRSVFKQNESGHYQNYNFILKLILLLDNCTDGQVRLIGGTRKAEGTVEVCYNGLWGSICHASWDTSDATVVCRQLGYPTIGTNINFISSLKYIASLLPIRCYLLQQCLLWSREWSNTLLCSIL